MDLKSKRDDIIRLATSHGARNLRLFGSVARNKIGRTAMSTCWSTWTQIAPSLDLVALGQDLEDLLQRKVDVLTAASVQPALRDRILSEARPL